MTRFHAARPWLLPLLLIIGVAVVVAACGGGSPGGSGAPGEPTPNPAAVPLAPAQPDNPLNLFAWLFTPIFQALFIVLAASYVALDTAGVPGAIGIAIVVLTLVVRTLLIPLFRRQLVSQRRMQMLQPELAEAKRRYKGDRMKAQQAQQEIMRERGVNPVSGCLPILLQLPILFVIYSVIQNGITNFDPTQMLQIAGVQVVPLTCPPPPAPLDAAGRVIPCIDPVVPWLAGLNVSVPEVFIGTAGNFLSGLGILSIISAILQLIQSRMMLTPSDPNNDDPNLRVQRQMMLFLPLISIAWGSILPAGLFIYWIVATLFSIVQQYLIVGWGAMFPLFGWTPGFATNHTPRFPVSLPPPDPTKRSPTSPSRDSTNRATSANKTIRPRERGRQGRRGRRR